MKTGGLARVSGLQPCEPYHVEKRGVNKLGGSRRPAGAGSALSRRLEGAAAGAGGRGQVVVGVGEREETRLELGRGEEDASFQHRVEEARVPLGVRALRGRVVGDGR